MSNINIFQISDDISSLVTDFADLTDPLEGVARNILDDRYHAFGPDGLQFGKFLSGNVPLLFTCPHGGIPDVELGFTKREYKGKGRDLRSKEFTVLLTHFMEEYCGIRPYVIVNELNRHYIDLNRKTVDAFVDNNLILYYDDYYSKIREFMKKMAGGLHISWHTCATSRDYRMNDKYEVSEGLRFVDNPEELMRPLPLVIQMQGMAPIIFGTHLRKTVNKKRSIDFYLAEQFRNFSFNNRNLGINVFCPNENDYSMVLGGKHEIYTGLEFAKQEIHPIDAIQIEMRNKVLKNSFDVLLGVAAGALKEVIRKYGV
ncbi:hypothetical protein BVX95_01835 [archaeon D22]|nr:hypothetical protein BVX95_01835 [archaeon D22]